MNKRIFFHGMDHSSVMENYANEHLAKIEQFLTNEREPISLDLTFYAEPKKDHHKVELLVKSPHYDLIVHRIGPDMYKLLGDVLDIMYRELHERKKELLDKLKTADSYKGA